MKVSIIQDADLPQIASFITDDDGNNVVFTSHETAEVWLMANAEKGVVYKHFDSEQ